MAVLPRALMETQYEHEVHEVPALHSADSFTAVQEWTGTAASETNVLRAEEKDQAFLVARFWLGTLGVGFSILRLLNLNLDLRVAGRGV